MGLRFRKSVRLGKFVRVNVSGSGVSLGLGPSGANMNIGPRGVRKTIGVPGTGLSYQSFTKWPQAGSGRQRRKAAPPSGEQPSVVSSVEATPRRLSFGRIAVFAVVGLALYAATRAPAPPLPVAPTVPAEPVSQTPTPTAERTTASPSGGVISPEGPSQVSDALPLTFDEVVEVQTWLKAFGLDPGPLDGLPGPLTTSAVKKYEMARQYQVSGSIDRQLLERLRKDKGGAIR